MDYVNYLKDLFGSIPDYKKVVLSIFLIKKDDDILHQIGFSEREITRLNLECKILLTEQDQEYLEYIKNEEQSILEKFLNKSMEQYFNNICENIRHERSLMLLLSIVEPDILRQSKFLDHEIEIKKI